MDSKDIMAGNYLNYKGKSAEVLRIINPNSIYFRVLGQDTNTLSENLQDFSGIKIDDNWLHSFGLKSNDETSKRYQLYEHSEVKVFLKNTNTVWELYYDYNGKEDIQAKILYIHELQNKTKEYTEKELILLK